MYQNALDAYLESRVLSAEPVELIGLLYQAGMEAVRDARRHLAAGDIAARSKSVSKACEILLELAGSLDHERGGEISRRLARLYEYMQRRLVEAHIRKSDEPMVEVLGLMATLTEAWNGVQGRREPLGSVESAWVPAVPETAAAGASSAWSL